MRIKLDGHYQNAAGVRIRPGIYEENDPRLHNLAGYLLQTEQAVITDEAPEPEHEETTLTTAPGGEVLTLDEATEPTPEYDFFDGLRADTQADKTAADVPAIEQPAPEEGEDSGVMGTGRKKRR